MRQKWCFLTMQFFQNLESPIIYQIPTLKCVILQTVLTIANVITKSSVFYVSLPCPQLTPIFLQKAVIKIYMIMISKAPELTEQRESLFQMIRRNSSVF